MIRKLMSRKKVGRLGNAEIKLAFIILHYIIHNVMGLGTFTYSEVVGHPNVPAELFRCENKEDAKVENEILLTMSLATIALLPLVLLLFTFNFKACKLNFPSG